MGYRTGRIHGKTAPNLHSKPAQQTGTTHRHNTPAQHTRTTHRHNKPHITGSKAAVDFDAAHIPVTLRLMSDRNTAVITLLLLACSPNPRDEAIVTDTVSETAPQPAPQQSPPDTAW